MKKSIVIVEDEQNIADAERLILEEHFDVHHAADGEEGLKKIMQIKPDVVLLDLMLPKMSGYSVCSSIRATKALNGTKVIMVTAKNQQRDEDLGMETGADDYIMKPFEAEELIHVVKQVLNRK
jgi:DNA-binding response OmpR family regulator